MFVEQVSATDPDTDSDPQGAGFLFAWSAIAPGASPLPLQESQQLFTLPALQLGTVNFPADTLKVRPGTPPLTAIRCICHLSATCFCCQQAVATVLPAKSARH